VTLRSRFLWQATTRAKFTRFWTAQTRFLARLYRSPLVTLAAIRGACPAGGCILALCCDERIMTSDAASCIGLNEVALGIAVPRCVQPHLPLATAQPPR
jgi:3,2-trans-enoyl-CoA isomerase